MENSHLLSKTSTLKVSNVQQYSQFLNLTHKLVPTNELQQNPNMKFQFPSSWQTSGTDL